MAHVGQGALNAVITPGRILLSETHYQITNLLGKRGASRFLLPAVPVVPLSSDQEPMPAQDDVGGEKSADLG
jgi:hypothetical protein